WPMGEIEDQLARLDAHRAAQVPAFSMATADELVVRRRSTRRARLVYAIAACLVVGLVIGGWFLLSGSRSSVIAPAGRRGAGEAGRCVGTAYVPNAGDGTVSVITTATGLVSATITIGNALAASGPGVAVTPDGKHVYVANLSVGTVSVITTATGVVSAPITVGTHPSAVAITPDGKYAYVPNYGDG